VKTSDSKSIFAFSLLSAVALLSACNNSDNQNIAPTSEPKANANAKAASSKIEEQYGLVNVLGVWKKTKIYDMGSHFESEKGMIHPRSKTIPIASNDSNETEMGLVARGSGKSFDLSYLWKGGTIPYVIEKDASGKYKIDERILKAFRDAIELFQASTPIRFVEYPAPPKDASGRAIKYFTLRNGVENPMVAAQATWGTASDAVFLVNAVEAELNRPNYVGIMAHELSHLVGMEHEFNRSDRDQHIKIDESVLKNDASFKEAVMCSFFMKFNDSAMAQRCGDSVQTAAEIGKFDAQSITMYGPYVFKIADPAKRHLPFISKKNGEPLSFYGASTLSKKDIRSIAYMYQSEGAPLIAPDREDGLDDITVAEGRETSVDFDVNGNVPDCSYVRVVGDPDFSAIVNGARVIQRDTRDVRKCRLTLGYAGKGYYDIQVRAYKSKTKSCYTTSSRYGRSYQTCNDIPSGVYSVEKVRVTVGNPNSAPTAISAAAENQMMRSITFAKNTDPERLITSLSTSDPDAGDKHIYAIDRSVNNSDHLSFVIVGNQLWSAQKLDKDKYTLSVISKDLAGNTVKREMSLIANNKECSQEVSNSLHDSVSTEYGTYVQKLRDDRNKLSGQRATLETSIRAKEQYTKPVADALDAVKALENKLKSFTSPSLAVHQCVGKFGSVNILGSNALGQMLGECSYDRRYGRVTGQMWCSEMNGPTSGSCARARKFFAESTREKLIELAIKNNYLIKRYKEEIKFLKQYASEGFVAIVKEIAELEDDLKKETEKVTGEANAAFEQMKNFPQWDQKYEVDNKAALEAIKQFNMNKNEATQALRDANTTLNQARADAEKGIKEELATNAEYVNLSNNLNQTIAALNVPFEAFRGKSFAKYLNDNSSRVAGCLVVLPYKAPEPPQESINRRVLPPRITL
jgi:hypothetical protein